MLSLEYTFIQSRLSEHDRIHFGSFWKWNPQIAKKMGNVVDFNRQNIEYSFKKKKKMKEIKYKYILFLKLIPKLNSLLSTKLK